MKSFSLAHVPPVFTVHKSNPLQLASGWPGAIPAKVNFGGACVKTQPAPWMRRYFFITTTLLLLSHPQVWGQAMTNPAPVDQALPRSRAAEEMEGRKTEAAELPVARVIPPATRPDQPHTESDALIERGGVLDLDGHVVVTYQDRRVEADHIAYDTNTGELTATGHVLVLGGANDERIHATHGTYNLKTGTGRFFEVTGSVGIKPRVALGPNPTLGGTLVAHNAIYTNSNPFLFSGRIVVKTGPQSYDLYDGAVTSCQLPHPDWQLSGQHFSIADGEARATNSIFHLIGLPLLWLPYVTHPTDPNQRQTGLLIPTFGISSTRGVYLGEQIYLVLNHSSDLTVGATYYSLRGWAQDGSFRYRGGGLDFATARYSGLLDKLTGSANQGGQDILFAGRHDFDSQTRVAANLEYLSSYVYREAFTDNFNQAVTSDIVSTAYAVNQRNGFERYQGIKNVETTPQQQVRIFHVPTLSFDALDHPLGPRFDSSFTSGRLMYSSNFAASGLKRSQPGLTTSGITERFDLHPELSLPMRLGNWHVDPSLAIRETLYTHSRTTGPVAGSTLENPASLVRSDVELVVPIRPPVVAKDFSSGKLARLVGPQLRHTIEPEITFRKVSGVNNFAQVLRFDATDVVSDTDEIEYGVTQRLFRRPDKAAVCQAPLEQQSVNPALSGGPADGPGPGSPDNPEFGPQLSREDRARDRPCGNQELLSWRVTQKFFVDQLFGNAVVDGRRNVFTTTLDLSGVAFLTEPRAFSPLISRLKLRTSANTDFEWDFDYDVGAKKFTSSNVFLNVHEGDLFSGVSYARLDAPGRFYTEGETPVVSSNGTVVPGVLNQISDFNQLRLLLGYGSPMKRGFSAAANVGLDLKALYGATQTVTTTTKGVTTSSTTTVYPGLVQYTSVQASYNWNCCGLAVEYRKFELGTVRNEPGYRFNFTLANIGAAGNLRRNERLF
jgi:LPS-assembly protein